ncbi:putative ubiquitinyl hydrolase 1 [Helianthus annuus]|uniref:Ubiquitinyl hydrolase 1 n=1 Tax=Helianthus annuus TaxID=4232 RepID=A0A9K3II86_HELAN|nr:putative ubiquitinyl hydrolase 1 [Helianthus annuus]KAJ0540233.1 putative ubiquitinyl hydrolase 1 [Helianthus annuus]KAJ0554977.1 putative ubiquitinyl hydrolase 1 [Helianthus annuus]KAJ0720545.1 putative ubiquitinyl hydrolase 1 [Helianthus annuus]KAJ0723742.1 putative ubiquitinyl hydrolase 1 [Helianthus annuus]
MRRNPKGNRNRSCKSNQLDVKGCRGVYASFDKYAEVERLEGDNKYHAEAHGLQDAKKGVLFNDFPHVLQLRLKRFEYDFTSDTMVNINNRYEFPLELDLDRENGKYLSPDADKCVRNLYTLHRAPQIYFHKGTVKNLESEVARASKLKCTSCGKKGAVLGCYVKSCQLTYHVPRAYDIPDFRWDSLSKYLYTHASFGL